MRPIGVACAGGGRIAYLFRFGRRDRLRDDGPREFTYGFTELAESGADVEMFDEHDLGVAPPAVAPVEALWNRISSLTLIHPRTLAAMYRKRQIFGRFSHLIGTSHGLGMVAALLWRFGLLGARPVLLVMGLIEADTGRIRIAWLRWLLGGCLLAALSKPEAQRLRRELGPWVEVRDFVFGVDTDFWKPGGEADHRTEVLSVGNDWKRDFATLVDAWRPEFPVLRIVTSLPVVTGKRNVVVQRGDWRSAVIPDSDMRALVRRARIVVVPLRETLQPSGQSASLQAMACARPVVLTANSGLWDRDVLERHRACRLVPPGDAAALSNAVSEFLADPAAAEAMGVRARRMLESEGITSRAMAMQIAGLVRPTTR